MWQLLMRWRYYPRYRQIIRVVSRHGWRYLTCRPGIGRSWFRLVGRGQPAARHYQTADRSRLLGQELCQVLEELGPTFVKLGQLLSTRPDLIPPEYARELARLQDGVEFFRPAEVRKQFSQQMKALPEQLFLEFDYQPIASASIAQVHRAVLQDGSEVAVKIQRPGLLNQLNQDLALLEILVDPLQRSVIGQVVEVAEVYRVFARQIRCELDFEAEGACMESYSKALEQAKCSGVRVPAVFWEYTTSGVLTMEMLPGVKIQQWYGTQEQGKKLATNLFLGIMAPFFTAGLFHGDPHPGNVLLLEDGSIGLVDFGVMGRLDALSRQLVARLLLALNNRDIQALLHVTLKMGRVTRPVVTQQLYEELAALAERVGLLGRGRVQLGSLLQGIAQVSLNHGICLPASFFSLGKAITGSEAVIRQLDPCLDPVELGSPLALAYLRRQMEPDLRQERLYQNILESLEMITGLPRNLSRAMERLAEGELKTIFVHRGLESLYKIIDVASTRMAASMVIVALIVGSALLLLANREQGWESLLLVGLMGFGASALAGIWLLIGMLRHGKLQ